MMSSQKNYCKTSDNPYHPYAIDDKDFPLLQRLGEISCEELATRIDQAEADEMVWFYALIDHCLFSFGAMRLGCFDNDLIVLNACCGGHAHKIDLAFTETTDAEEISASLRWYMREEYIVSFFIENDDKALHPNTGIALKKMEKNIDG